MNFATTTNERALDAVVAAGTPVAILHGERDALIPMAMGAALAARHPGIPFTPVPGAGHNDVLERAWPSIAAELRR